MNEWKELILAIIFKNHSRQNTYMYKQRLHHDSMMRDTRILIFFAHILMRFSSADVDGYKVNWKLSLEMCQPIIKVNEAVRLVIFAPAREESIAGGWD